MDCRAAGQENRGGRVRELESQLEEVRSHYHHRLRSLENQLQVLTTPVTTSLFLLSALHMAAFDTLYLLWACLLLTLVLERYSHLGLVLGTKGCWWDSIGRPWQHDVVPVGCLGA